MPKVGTKGESQKVQTQEKEYLSRIVVMVPEVVKDAGSKIAIL